MNRFLGGARGTLWVLVVVIAASVPILAKENVTVTVHAGARQTFEGCGAGQSIWDYQQGYDSLPQATRDTLARFLWHDLNFRFLRLRSTLVECADTGEECAGSLVYNYRQYVADAQAHQDSLVLLLGPDGEDAGNDPAGYARKYAQQIKTLRDSGIAVKYTGICDEPDVNNLLTAAQVPLLVRAFRTNLDSMGLQDVQIVAPENSSADAKAREFVDSIITDSQALAGLGAFSTHSYNWSITDEMCSLVGNYVLSNQKQYWMTEASDFKTEKWKDAQEASSTLSRYLADMNHLCNVWIFYIGIRGVESDWRMSGNQNTAFYMILYRTVEKDYGYLLKCWYFKQMAQAIVPGARVRASSTNLKQVNRTKYWRDEDSTMVYAYGKKPPLYLAAAVNPDGSWGIGITNYTGDSSQTPIDSTFDSTVYSVNVHIEELAAKDSVPFTVARCDADSPFVHTEPALVMRNGNVVIDSIGPFDMITLRSAPGVSAVAHDPRLPTRQIAAGIKRCSIQNGLISADVSLPLSAPTTSVVLTLFDLQGRAIASCSRPAPGQPGVLTVTWSAPAALSGVYVLRLNGAGAHATMRVVAGR